MLELLNLEFCWQIEHSVNYASLCRSYLHAFLRAYQASVPALHRAGDAQVSFASPNKPLWTVNKGGFLLLLIELIELLLNDSESCRGPASLEVLQMWFKEVFQLLRLSSAKSPEIRRVILLFLKARRRVFLPFFNLIGNLYCSKQSSLVSFCGGGWPW